MCSIRKSYFFRFLVITAICSAFIAGMVYYFSSEKSRIQEFNYATDAKGILKMFDQDWYWLVAGSTPQEYNPDITLKYRTLHGDPRYFGKLIIKVIREGSKVAGFTAYYKQSMLKGFLLYVGVGRAFRGKGYGRMLTNYAVKDLFSRGCRVVKLITRTDNVKARGLYKKLGFTETKEEDGFAYYEIRKK